MGLFDKFFGKKEDDKNVNQQNKISTHEEEWEIYFSNVDDIIGSFFIDLGLKQIAPIAEKQNLIWVSLKMNNPREDGLSSNEEYEKLLEIEDNLIESISKKLNTVYAGRLTSNNDRDFYFYCGDTTLFDKVISEAMVSFPSYSYDFGVKEDKEWKSYFDFLFPNPRQYQSILNRRVIDNLEENGDNLTKERQVDHWIYFKTKTDRQNFVNQIKDKNFQIIDSETIVEDTEYSHTLQIARVDKVDLESANEYILELWQLANENNGEYDGWETSIEKD